MSWKWKGGFMKIPGEKQTQATEKKQRGRPLPVKAIVVLCAASFLLGSLLSNRIRLPLTAEKTKSGFVLGTQDCAHKRKLEEGNPRDATREVTRTIQSLEKSISSLEMELAADRRGAAVIDGSTRHRKKVFAVIGINTAFSSKRRRESLRQTWMPRGSKLAKLEKEKGLVMRFVIGHSATPGDALDRAIDAEAAATQDFLRLNHTEGYHELTAKTKTYFATAVALWDADFYVKVDDDVHVNLGMLMATLARHRTKPRVYIGCMKSGPVLFQKEMKYYEPEFSKFGGEGNQYFRHATGQIYAISKDLATFVSINSPILHKYANEDVSLGSWLIGLDVEHVDDRAMCCGTPPDCEWRKKAGDVCVASFDWSCSGICKSVERMEDVHTSCGEGDDAIWGFPCRFCNLIPQKKKKKTKSKVI